MPSTAVSVSKQKGSSIVEDIMGGLAAMLVALPSSIAFGILVYSSIGSEFSGLGAMSGLVGAAALGVTTPFIGRTKGLISAPCAPSAAVLSALVVALLATTNVTKPTPAEIITTLTIVAFLSAIFQILYGAFGGGKLIKFIPYQVVSGYLSGVGILIALSQLPKLLGLPKGMNLYEGLLNINLWKWPGLIVGVVTMLVMVLTPRITRKIPGAILGLIAGVISYFCLALLHSELFNLQGNSLIIGPLQASGSLIDGIQNGIKTQFNTLSLLNFNLIKNSFIPALTLSVLLSIDTLKTCVGLDAITRSRHNSNRELIGQGLGNFFSTLLGGMPGAGTMGPTLVNISSGGQTPKAGLFEGFFVLLALLFLGPLIAWVPIGSLAGVLLVIAYRMFDKSIFKLLKHHTGRLDFAVILGVILVAVFDDLITASGVGIGFSIFLFIRDQIQDTVILKKSYLNEISSKTRRQEADRKILETVGSQAVLCKLQGNLFFGTTDQLLTKLDQDLKQRKYILFDMRRVRSIDYTAIHLFEMIQGQLKEKSGQLCFSGMPSGLFERRDFQKYLKQMGLVEKEDGVMIFETTDSALVWMEEQLLSENGGLKSQEGAPLELKDFSLFRQFSDEEIKNLEASCVARKLSPGETLFRQGESGDEMFLVRKGSLDVLLPLSGNRFHHIATISRGAFIGELSFLDGDVRSANGVAKTEVELFSISRKKFNEQSRLNPAIGAQVFARLASVIANRLRVTDTELRVLEDQ